MKHKAWLNIKSRLVTQLYLGLDRLGISRENAMILMFHHVTNENVDASPECKCDVEHFVRILNHLKSKKIRVVSPSEALANVKKGVRKGYAVITFDDGLDNTFKIAYPILKKYGYPFTVYVTLGYLNKKGYMTTEELGALTNERLCTIGAHSLTHPVLSKVPYSRQEIIQSKKQLERLIKREVQHFAYPYGGPHAVSYKNLCEVKEAGFITAVSTVESKINYISSINKLYLPRVNGSFFNPS
jgi:peptidoglycan/xylan/chitin deacetylase (PgdA/CDA1 family)